MKQLKTKISNVVQSDDSEVQDRDSSDSSKEDIFEIDQILDKKIQDGITYYLVKWKNYPSQGNSWQPVCNFINGQSHILQFQRSQKNDTDHKKDIFDSCKALKKSKRIKKQYSPSESSQRNNSRSNDQQNPVPKNGQELNINEEKENDQTDIVNQQSQENEVQQPINEEDQKKQVPKKIYEQNRQSKSQEQKYESNHQLFRQTHLNYHDESKENMKKQLDNMDSKYKLLNTDPFNVLNEAFKDKKESQNHQIKVRKPIQITRINYHFYIPQANALNAQIYYNVERISRNDKVIPSANLNGNQLNKLNPKLLVKYLQSLVQKKDGQASLAKCEQINNQSKTKKEHHEDLEHQNEQKQNK